MKTLNKNIRREFKNSISRFLSISALLMLSVFVLTGLNATGSDMRETAINLYTKENLADAKINSTIPLETDDKNIIKSLNGINKVEFGSNEDVLISATKKSIKLQSLPDSISKITLTKGRKARNSSEVVLSDTLKKDYKIDDQIKFDSGKTNLKTNLKTETFKVVGFATSTEFLKKDTVGTTSIGNGKLTGYGFVTKTAFENQKPNFARLEFSKKVGQAYSDEYEEYSTKKVDELQKKLTKQNTKRINNLRVDLDKQIFDAETKINSAENSLNQKIEQVKQLNNPTLLATLNEQKNELQKEKDKITDAKNQREQLDNVTLNIQDRSEYNEGYNNYGEDAARIDSLGKSFPAFFFLIAILVSFTTMRRMVEEKRIEMGTLRALGYSKDNVMKEFLIYSVSTAVVGTILGSLLGFLFLPKVIFKAYTANFNFSQVDIGFYPLYVVIGLTLALLSTVFASWLAARESLKIIPAELMLPKPPANGSRILLERITPLWKHMSFSHKVTARNLFRYKGRMLMTIIGVAGATALMLTGFGIKDSLNTINEQQFGNITKYDILAAYNPHAKQENISNLTKFVNNDQEIKEKTTTHFEKVLIPISTYEPQQETTLIVPTKSNDLNNFIKLKDYQTHKKMSLSNDGAIISQKIAKLKNIKIGDDITIKGADGTKKKVKIVGITKMYAGHFIYMNEIYYNKIFKEAPTINSYLLTLKKSTTKNIESFEYRFNKNPASILTINSQETKSSIDNILNNLNNLILVLVSAASLLSLVVLYTLTNINVSERIRELSTLKVLGFYQKEVLLYIYREANILTGLGILVGLLFGFAFHTYIMNILPPATAMVDPGLTWINILISVTLTVIFSLIVMFLMNKKIKDVDMLEALKSVD